MLTSTALSVPLVTVTPLFLAGADPRGTPELRPPAFRGALRYWLRAALGGVYGGDLAAVRRAEAAVFGSPDVDLGGASAIGVRIGAAGFQTRAYERSRDRQPPGSDYLYWSMFVGSPSKQYIRPGEQFTLTLAQRPGARTADAAQPQAAAALWLLLQLGGIGSRSRRTGGSLSLSEPFDAFGLRFALPSAVPEAVAARLEEGLRRVRALVAPDGAAGLPAPALPDFDVLQPGLCRVWVLGRWIDATEAVDELGAKLRGFRIGQPGGPRTGPSLDERAVFGLPLKGLDMQRGMKAIDRRASPLWLRVSMATDGRAVAIATLFRSRFAPPGTMPTRRGQAVAEPADFALIERWIGESFPAAREVLYA